MNSNKKAFTLAEIMIVIAVIGIITAILVPIAFNSTPDDKIMKFKKANATLYSTVKMLVKSDKYYKDGDLGKKPDGSDVPVKYFCETLADNLSTKSVNCKDTDNNGYMEQHTCDDWGIESIKSNVDSQCSAYVATMGDEIITSDGVHWYEISPAVTYSMFPYGVIWDMNGGYGTGGIYRCYRTLCIDIDGSGNTPPFGYAIRRDGKIITGARADEWLKKSIRGDNTTSEAAVPSVQNQGAAVENEPLDCTQFGQSCTACSQDECNKCSDDPGIILHNGECKSCSSVYEIEQCAKCDENACTQCNSGYFLNAENKCISCSEHFNEHCLTCESNHCTSCSVDSGIILLNGACQSCSYVFQDGCITCDENRCLSTDKGYYLNNEGKSVSCSQKYGTGCSACSSSACTLCDGDGIILHEGACTTCFEVFGTNCTSCTESGCTACDTNFHSLRNGICSASCTLNGLNWSNTGPSGFSDHSAAASHCASIGGRLPTYDEYAEIVNNAPCGYLSNHNGSKTMYLAIARYDNTMYNSVFLKVKNNVIRLVRLSATFGTYDPINVVCVKSPRSL